jgi:hypothetical protein
MKLAYAHNLFTMPAICGCNGVRAFGKRYEIYREGYGG